MAGGEVWIRTLAEHLTAKHVDITAALHIRGPLYAALSEIGIATHQVPLDFLQGRDSRAFLSSGVGLVRSGIRLAQLARRDRAHVIHAFSPESAEVASLASYLSRIPLVATVQNCGPYPKFDRYVLRSSDRVIAISQAVADDLLGLGVAPERAIQISVGITFDRLPPSRSGQLRRDLGITVDTPLVGLVATLEWKKAQDVFIRAIPQILANCPTAEFVLVGGDHESTPTAPGAYEAELRQLALALGVAHRVHFLGFRPNAVTLIGDLDISVLCSRREALGLVAVESLALGVPVVATAVEGLREVVEDGVTGLLVPPDAPQALAVAICRLLADGAFAARVAAMAPAAVRQRFDAPGLAAQHRALYQTLIGVQRGTAR